MEQDPIDLFVAQWGRERPDLDASPLRVVSRVLMLGRFLETFADRALAAFGMGLWQFDVLAALRRSGPPFRLHPKQLMGLVTLSSGAMTNRIDRLQEMGLVKRLPDPDDRRGVLIALTSQGRKLVDEAITVRLRDAEKNLAGLSPSEVDALASLLRKLLISVVPASARFERMENAPAKREKTRGTKRPRPRKLVAAGR